MAKIILVLNDRQLAQLKLSLKNDYVDNDIYSQKVITNILEKISISEGVKFE